MIVKGHKCEQVDWTLGDVSCFVGGRVVGEGWADCGSVSSAPWDPQTAKAGGDRPSLAAGTRQASVGLASGPRSRGFLPFWYLGWNSTMEGKVRRAWQ